MNGGLILRGEKRRFRRTAGRRERSRRMKQEKLAIAAVPVQEWGDVYDREEALKRGTVFPELDLPFFRGGRGGQYGRLRQRPDGRGRKPGGEDAGNSGSRFLCGWDLRLYLDTHPEEEKAHALFRGAIQRKRELMREFARELYPLTPDCMAELYAEHPEQRGWLWQKGLPPWEGGCR